MEKIRVGSMVVLNENAVKWLNEFETIESNMLKVWQKSQMEFVVLDIIETNNGVVCNVEGFAFPINCLDLADMQK